MVMTSPLLHGKITKTPLDLVTDRLYGLFPLDERQIQYLNTIIYKDNVFWINYWSFTHFFLGFFVGFVFKRYLTIRTYSKLHILFELWELWAGGYIVPVNNVSHKLDIQEITDTLLDITLGILGFYVGSL